jgi:hypothetical protein
MVMHRGQGLPLAALGEETQALVKLTWTRLHLQPAYWLQDDSSSSTDLAAFVVREEPLPALDGQGMYTPSSDDHGCLLTVHLISSPKGTARRRLLLSKPVGLDARVNSEVEAALQASSWVRTCGRVSTD